MSTRAERTEPDSAATRAGVSRLAPLPASAPPLLASRCTSARKRAASRPATMWTVSAPATFAEPATEALLSHAPGSMPRAAKLERPAAGEAARLACA
jgi:hypothetical protein